MTRGARLLDRAAGERYLWCADEQSPGGGRPAPAKGAPILAITTAPCPANCKDGFNLNTRMTCKTCKGTGKITVNVPDDD